MKESDRGRWESISMHTAWNYWPVCLSFCLSVCQSVCLFVCLSVYRTVCLSVFGVILGSIWRKLDLQCSVIIIIGLLAYRPASRAFRLALRGYSVALLPRTSHFALASRFARKFSEKNNVSQSTRNALKRIEMQTKKPTPLTHCALRA